MAGESSRAEFRLLGDVQIVVDGDGVDAGHARQRSVLAVLLVEPNRVISADQLLDRAWAGRPPQRARAALSGYVSRLRQILRPIADVRILRRGDGYLLTVDPLAVDLHQFRHLVTEARASDGGADVRIFERALRLWHGEALAMLDTPWLNAVREGLHAERLAAELDRNDLALTAGRHAELLPELSARCAAYPLDERLAAQLILALYRVGRQAEALRRYEELRQRLAEELGADPRPALQQLHKQILTGDPDLSIATGAGAAQRNRPVPKQLPPPPRPFSGRLSALAALDSVLATAHERPLSMPIATISGTAGVGKTALAMHWAHRVAERFDDGQLYLDLRGFDPAGSVLDPADALRGFLDAYGIPPESTPSLETQTALYRSLVAGRRVLVVLDNARDAQQVRPLLPGTPGCMVLVTSRDQLTGLVAGEGAYPVALDLLSPAESSDLLAGRIGVARVAAEPDAARDIVARCARLPLALTVAAARAATHPDFPLATLAAELADAHASLDVLNGGDAPTDVRAVFSWSYNTLGDPAARLFRLLGLHPGPDIAAAAVASLAGTPPAQVRLLLVELARAQLVTEHVPGRYGLHDLLRVYAAELAQDVDTETERGQALHRMLDHYLHTAHAADRLIPQPHRILGPIVLAPAQAGATPEDPPDLDRAMAWFTAEHPVLLAAIELAAGHGLDLPVWQLTWTLCTYLERRGRWHARAAALQTALAAAERLEDRNAQAALHCSLGSSFGKLLRFADADTQLRRALELYRALGNQAGEAAQHVNLSWVLHQQGRMQEALLPAQRALALYRDVDRVSGQAVALNNLAWSYAHLGDHDQALAHCRQAIALHQAIHDRHGEACALDSLGYVHHRADHHQAAIDAYQQALDVLRDHRDQHREACTLDHLGDAHLAASDPDAAQEAWRTALAILIELADPAAEQLRAKLNRLPDRTGCW